jgi:hypothetical protein
VVITKTKDGNALPANCTYEIDDLQHDTVFNLVVRYGSDPSSVAEVQRSKTVTIVEARIDNFVVEPVTIGKGLPCIVTWETNADTCTLDYAGQTVEFAGSNGSTTLKFDASTSVTLTATKGTSQAQDSRNVTVVPPIIKSFTASTTGPMYRDQTAVRLTWDTEYAESVSLTPSFSESVGPTGSLGVAPANTTTYTLRCTGLGPDVVQQITIVIRSVAIDSFTVSPEAIDPGGSATLSWNTELADAVSIDNGIGSVAASGSVPIPTHPVDNVTYTLTCQGPNGPVSQQLTLNVNCVRITNLHVEDPDPRGPEYIIHWSVEFATHASLSCNIGGILFPVLAANEKVEVGSSGSLPFRFDDHPLDLLVFTLTAWGPGNSPVTVSTSFLEVL